VAEWSEDVKTGAIFDIEFRIRNKNGEHRWFQTRTIPIRDAHGKPLKWYGANKDVHERKQAEMALRASEARYRSYIDLTGQLGWVIHANGEVEEAIPSFRKFTRQSLEDTADTGWTKTLHPDVTERTLDVSKCRCDKKQQGTEQCSLHRTARERREEGR
jgi:PAS domain-containing protein